MATFCYRMLMHNYKAPITKLGNIPPVRYEPVKQQASKYLRHDFYPTVNFHAQGIHVVVLQFNVKWQK